jgi:hypothetical protein
MILYNKLDKCESGSLCYIDEVQSQLRFIDTRQYYIR